MRAALRSRLHLAVGVLVCVVLPGASYLDGSGRLAFSMFAEVSDYRLEITATRDDGSQVAIPATFLAARAGTTAGAATFLAGAEQWKTGPTHRTPRRLLGPLAALACADDSAGAAISVRVALIERDDAASPERRYAAERACPR